MTLTELKVRLPLVRDDVFMVCGYIPYTNEKMYSITVSYKDFKGFRQLLYCTSGPEEAEELLREFMTFARSLGLLQE